jgi:uncharacterized protein
MECWSLSAPATRLDGSSLCLACGLCCNGALHSHAIIGPDEVVFVTELGMTCEITQERLGFRLPCPLYREQRCPIYAAKRPRVCGDYRCNLLKAFLAGTLTLEQGVQRVQRARELFAAVLAQMPPGYSYARLCDEVGSWDAGVGLGGSPELRRANAPLLLTLVTLIRYLRKHFGKPKM